MAVPMTSSELLVRIKNKKGKKEKKKSRSILCTRPTTRPLQQQWQQQQQQRRFPFRDSPNWCGERNKKGTFENVCRENQMFLLSPCIVCHTTTPSSIQKKKYPIWLDGIGQHPVADARPKKRDDASWKKNKTKKQHNHKRNSTRTSSSSYH